MRKRVIELAFLSCWLAACWAGQERSPVTREKVDAAIAHLEPYIHSALDKTRVPGLSARLTLTAIARACVRPTVYKRFNWSLAQK